MENVSHTFGDFVPHQMSELQKSLIFNSMKEMVTYHLPDNLKIAWANDAVGATVGKNSSEIIGHYCYSVWHNRTAPCINCPVLETFKSKQPQIIEMHGSDNRYYELRTYPVFDESKVFQGVVEYSFDITEKINLQQQLLEREQHYRIIFEQSPILFLEEDFSLVKQNIDNLKSSGVVDFNTFFHENPTEVLKLISASKTMAVNQAVLHILEFDSQDALVANIQQIFTSQSITSFRQALVSLAKGKTYFECQSELKTKNGEIKQFFIKSFIPDNCKATFSRVIITMTDITSLKAYELQLAGALQRIEESEIRYRQLFENIPNCFALHEIICDSDGVPVDYKFITVNPAFERETGLLANNIIGHTIKQVSPKIEDLWIKNYGQVALTGETIHFIDFSHEFGKYFEVHAFCPKKNFFAVLFNDVTSQKKLEADLISAKEKAQENDRLKTAFLNNISHEIRTPLNSILGFVALLNCEDSTSEKQILFKELIEKSSYQLLGIIENIVEISKLQAGDVHLYETKIAVNGLLVELNQQFNNLATQKNLKFTYYNKLETEQNTIITDFNKLRRCLEYLIENAIKFTLNGSVEFGCQMSPTDRGFIEFQVSDTGIGISEEMQNVIFEPFRQVETGLTRRFGGNGLGLAITKGYITKLGGDIWLKSAVNSGTTFSFSIPFKPEKPVITHVIKPKEMNLSDKTILIVEDEESNYYLLAEYFEETNVNLIYAKDGAVAIDSCRNDAIIDLILMDLKMPEVDGFAATEIIRSFRPEIPIVAQTAFAHENDIAQILASGFIGYITKPISPVALFEAIQKFIK